MDPKNFYGNNEPPTDVEVQDYSAPVYGDENHAQPEQATLNGEAFSNVSSQDAAPVSASIPPGNTKKPRFNLSLSKNQKRIGVAVLVVALAGGAAVLTNKPKKSGLPRLPTVVETVPASENSMMSAGNGMDGQSGVSSGPLAAASAAAMQSDPNQSVSAVSAVSAVTPAAAAPVAATPAPAVAATPAVDPAAQGQDQRLAFDLAQQKLTAETLKKETQRKAEASGAENRENAALTAKVAALEAKLARLEPTAGATTAADTDKPARTAKRRAAAVPAADSEAAIMEREARTEREQRNAERRAERRAALAEKKQKGHGGKKEAAPQVAAAPAAPAPESIRLIGAATRDGNPVVILESNGVKYQKARNEMLPGVGVIDNIVIQNGVPVIEINGVTYR